MLLYKKLGAVRLCFTKMDSIPLQAFYFYPPSIFQFLKIISWVIEIAYYSGKFSKTYFNCFPYCVQCNLDIVTFLNPTKTGHFRFSASDFFHFDLSHFWYLLRPKYEPQPPQILAEDVSFHMRYCLLSLDKNWSIQSVLNWPKSLHRLGLKCTLFVWDTSLQNKE